MKKKISLNENDFVQDNCDCVKTLNISVEQWRELSGEDAHITVKIMLNGHSMHPLVRKMQDYVTVSPLRRKVKKGDIVLFKRADGQHVVHRVKKLFGDEVQTMGDNCSAPDRPVSRERILGLITHVHKGGRTLYVDTPFWRIAGRAWLAALPLRKFAAPVVRQMKKLIRAFSGR